MVEAALAHESSTRVVDVPDTGTLRGDLIALMHAANRSRVDLLVVTAVLLDGYFTERGSNPEQLRARMLADRRPAVEAIIERALDRGEIDASTLKPHLISLPLDLFRHEVLMTLKPVSGKTIEQIVDDITMPLLTQRARRTAQEA
ncbi:TetR-like C-terminal domain-containing protein [Nocardia brasiliensis]|nr:TetR-like C-terminal domain-containing protein [Nocardia brasiliensis]